jgi:hypothetical protein
MKELQEMQKEIVSGTRDVRQARSKTWKKWFLS